MHTPSRKVGKGAVSSQRLAGAADMRTAMKRGAAPESRPAAARKRQVAARIWLSYYNRVLYEKGILTEGERNRMELQIGKWQMP